MIGLALVQLGLGIAVYLVIVGAVALATWIFNKLF